MVKQRISITPATLSNRLLTSQPFLSACYHRDRGKNSGLEEKSQVIKGSTLERGQTSGVEYKDHQMAEIRCRSHRSLPGHRSKTYLRQAPEWTPYHLLHSSTLTRFSLFPARHQQRTCLNGQSPAQSQQCWVFQMWMREESLIEL